MSLITYIKAQKVQDSHIIPSLEVLVVTGIIESPKLLQSDEQKPLYHTLEIKLDSDIDISQENFLIPIKEKLYFSDGELLRYLNEYVGDAITQVTCSRPNLGNAKQLMAQYLFYAINVARGEEPLKIGQNEKYFKNVFYMGEDGPGKFVNSIRRIRQNLVPIPVIYNFPMSMN